MAALNDQQLEMCSTSTWNFSDLSALFINCTLKRSPELSHTQGLIDVSAAMLVSRMKPFGSIPML